MRRFVNLSFSLMLLLVPLAVSADQQMFEGSAPGLQSVANTGYLATFGDLVKLKNDNDPATTADAAVYYIDRDLKRRVFPNRAVYDSWYADFSGVREITQEEMSRIRIGGNVTYRPGTWLVKIPSVPKVYAVELGRTLRWIMSEEVANALYGKDWSKRVIDLPETYFTDYSEGAPLNAAVWPSGALVRRASDTALFLIDGANKRYLPPGTSASLRLQERFVVGADDALTYYGDGANVASSDGRFTDTSEMFAVTTESPPGFDFQSVPSKAGRGSAATLYSFRIASGQSVSVKKLSVIFSDGYRAADGKARLTSIWFEDEKGERIMGTFEPSSCGCEGSTVNFSGAYAMDYNSTATLTLKAVVAPDAPSGTKIGVELKRSGVTLSDGYSGKAIDRFWPTTDFPTREIEVM